MIINRSNTETRPNEPLLTFLSIYDCALNRINFSVEQGTWPTSTGITLEMAVTSCRSQIEANLSAGACGKIVSADLTAAIDTCVEDVQVMYPTHILSDFLVSL